MRCGPPANRLSQTVGAVTTNYGYGTRSDLLTTQSVGGTVTQTLGYTADGRMASLNPGVQAPSGQYITSLSYNQDARLAAVNAAGGALASYTYDGFGQRLIKTVSASYGEVYQYGQDGLLLEETDASGTAQADYIYLDGRPVAVLNGSTLYYLHDDMLGTPQLATDSNQAVQWQASYDPFGQASVSGTITQNLRFPGQYFDVESGWNHNGFRDYAPGLGRYLEPDPLGRLGSGNNLYAYVGNNPVDLVDSLGLCPKCQQQSNQTTVTLNSRQANIPGGGLLHDLGVNHEWISTPDGVSVGMGTAQGVPQSDFPGVQTQVVNHTGQVPTSTQTFTGVDRAALATYTKVGTPTGRWLPGVNDCNTWAQNAIEQSTPHNIYSGFDPTGAPPHIIYRNVVVYADGSIHSPGGQ
jgi:RHS repeat-associated protein